MSKNKKKSDNHFISIQGITIAGLFVIFAGLAVYIASNLRQPEPEVAVVEAQQWYNATYTGKKGYVEIDEENTTNEETQEALVRALQIETGNDNPDGVFGMDTEENCPVIENSDSASENVIRILQYGLYCKGYEAGVVDGNYNYQTKRAVKKLQTDVGLNADGVVTPQIFKSVLSQDVMKLAENGDSNVRTIQQYINNKYSQYIGIKQCDGIYSKETNKALICALQIEEGYKKPDGIFGNGTLSKCPTIDENCGKEELIKLVQAALYLNGYYEAFELDGKYDEDLKEGVKAFQKFMKLPDNEGITTNSTMKSLLVSSGDKKRSGTACDTATRLNESTIATLKEAGYTSVGRYLTKVQGGLDKNLTKEEAELIINSGLSIIPIYQTIGRGNDYFTIEQGNTDAIEAIKAAIALGIPYGSTIYFGVDYDMYDSVVTSHIIPYFAAINARFSSYGSKYKVGIYASRNACTRVSEAGFASYCYVSDMSTAFNGNVAYKMPKNWAFDQISEFTCGKGAGSIGIDKLVMSGRDMGVTKLYSGVALVDSDTIEKLSQHVDKTPVNVAGGILNRDYKVGFNDNSLLDFSLSYSSDVAADSMFGKGISTVYDMHIEEIADNEETEEDESLVRLYVDNGTYVDYHKTDDKDSEDLEFYDAVKKVIEEKAKKTEEKAKEEIKEETEETASPDENTEEYEEYILEDGVNNEIEFMPDETEKASETEEPVLTEKPEATEEPEKEIDIKSLESDKYISDNILHKNDILRKYADGTYTVNFNMNKVYTFNAEGKLIKVTDNSGSGVEVIYEDTMITLKNIENSQYLVMTLDEQKRVNKITDDLVIITNLSYDEKGRLTSISEADGRGENYLYDDYNRMIMATNTVGEVLFNTEYDAFGRVISYTDKENTTYEYNDSAIDGTTVITKKTGDNVITYTLNKDKILLEKKDKDSVITNYSYDANLNITKAEDSNSKVHVTRFDEKNRLIYEVTNDGEIITYEYDIINNLVRELRSSDDTDETEAPEVTESPEKTEVPLVTEEPEETSIPKVTQKPHTIGRKKQK
ncbi:MAG: DUF1906 domain-containing protein [Lachnospiraceae bacterium]|nr:DUF1906 domain-containing protein [Lachnospiraceae bacterium]